MSLLTGVSAEVLQAAGDRNPQIIALVAVLIGIVLAVVIQQLTGYFTEVGGKPVQDVGKTALTGPATVVLSGFTLAWSRGLHRGRHWCAVFGAYLLGGGSIVLGLFAIALAGTGLLTTVASSSRWTPSADLDNAQGIAEMSGDIDEAGARVLNRPRRGRQHHQGHSPRASRSRPPYWPQRPCSVPSVTPSKAAVPAGATDGARCRRQVRVPGQC